MTFILGYLHDTVICDCAFNICYIVYCNLVMFLHVITLTDIFLDCEDMIFSWSSYLTEIIITGCNKTMDRRLQLCHTSYLMDDALK